ncbi:MAG: sigma-70 family RNA polymerase sigma factor [Saprospiraceae bacterium]|nr:sigma-70 family RNA polymerase sigma factor [Saprospiraceae bacterium]
MDSVTVIDGLKNNNPDTFRELYRIFGGMIVGYVKKNSGSDHDAREMVHTVLLELWNAVRENRYNDRGKLERYVYILTSNTWRDELRRRQVRHADTLDEAHIAIADDSDLSVAEAIVKDHRIEALHHCLARLESPCNDIIRLYHLQEISLQDVAQRLNYDYNNLRKRIFDCRKKLKKMVDEWLHQQSASLQSDD